MTKRPRTKPDNVTATPARCRRCDSTERTRYTRTDVHAHAGRLADGTPYTHIVRRWTRCAKCNQARVERSHENRRAAPPAAEIPTEPTPAEPTRSPHAANGEEYYTAESGERIR